MPRQKHKHKCNTQLSDKKNCSVQLVLSSCSSKWLSALCINTVFSHNIEALTSTRSSFELLHAITGCSPMLSLIYPHYHHYPALGSIGRATPSLLFPSLWFERFAKTNTYILNKSPIVPACLTLGVIYAIPEFRISKTVNNTLHRQLSSACLNKCVLLFVFSIFL